MNPFRHLVGPLGLGIGPSHGFYIHRAAQHRKREHASLHRAGFEPAVQDLRSMCPVIKHDQTVTRVTALMYAIQHPRLPVNLRVLSIPVSFVLQ